jgi:CRP/FNR family cyclic AMP-dependent transcriptional regulator
MGARMRKVNTLDYKILQLLGRVDFFKDFSIADKQVLVDKAGMIVVAEEDEYVIRQGSIDPTMYIPLTGELEVRLTDRTGREVPIARIQVGDTVGEIAFLTDTPRSANVIAPQQMLLFRCTQTALRGLAQSTREKFKDQLIMKLVERLKQKNIEISEWGEEFPD